MCSTASVQVCVDAGLEEDGLSGCAFRWRLLHALGPVLVGTFANSPLRRGQPTGWKCTRQLVWSRLDPGRTRSPAGAEPAGPAVQTGPGDAAMLPPGAGSDALREHWIRYAMDADVLCMRRPDGQPWTVPTGLTFRDWLRGGGRPRAPAAPTADDLSYHLSTLFPPVRPRGHLELRMIDAQPGDGWIVPVSVVAALTDDPVAADEAMAAAEPIWERTSPAEPAGAVPRQRTGAARGTRRPRGCARPGWAWKTPASPGRRSGASTRRQPRSPGPRPPSRPGPRSPTSPSGTCSAVGARPTTSSTASPTWKDSDDHRPRRQRAA